MKKILASITLIVYLVVSSGVIINYHYCMNRLASVELFGDEGDSCSKCGMEMDSHGCCRDEVLVIKVEDDQQTSHFVSFIASIATPVVVPSAFIDEAAYNINEFRHWHNHSPPLLSGQDNYLHNRVFRI